MAVVLHLVEKNTPSGAIKMSGNSVCHLKLGDIQS
jgi:hypothetical protein